MISYRGRVRLSGQRPDPVLWTTTCNFYTLPTWRQADGQTALVHVGNGDWHLHPQCGGMRGGEWSTARRSQLPGCWSYQLPRLVSENGCQTGGYGAQVHGRCESCCFHWWCGAVSVILLGGWCLPAAHIIVGLYGEHWS